MVEAGTFHLSATSAMVYSSFGGNGMIAPQCILMVTQGKAGEGANLRELPYSLILDYGGVSIVPHYSPIALFSGITLAPALSSSR